VRAGEPIAAGAMPSVRFEIALRTRETIPAVSPAPHHACGHFPLLGPRLFPPSIPRLRRHLDYSADPLAGLGAQETHTVCVCNHSQSSNNLSHYAGVGCVHAERSTTRTRRMRQCVADFLSRASTLLSLSLFSSQGFSLKHMFLKQVVCRCGVVVPCLAHFHSIQSDSDFRSTLSVSFFLV
jgi:hypothetical protein